MSIGSGIAIAAMWAFAGLCIWRKDVTGTGITVALIAALIGTFIVALAAAS